MHFGEKLARIIAVVLLGVLCFAGTKLEMPIIEDTEAEDDAWFQAAEDTINVWYYEEELSDIISYASVIYGRENGVSVIPHLASPDDYLETANRAILEGNNGPDVLFIPTENLEKAYLSSLVCEVSDPTGLISEDNFPQSAMNAVTYGGKYIAYPFAFEVPVMVFNRTFINDWAKAEAEKTLEATRKDPDSIDEDDEDTLDRLDIAERVGIDENELFMYYALKAFPDTLEEFLDFADGFEAPEGVDKVLLWDVNDIFYNYWLVGGSVTVGGIYGDDVDIINVSNEKAATAVSKYKSLITFFSIEPDKADYDTIMQDFCDGKLLFSICTSDAIKMLAEKKEAGEIEFDYDFKVLPDISDAISTLSLNETQAIGISDYSEHKDIANSFISWFLMNYSEDLFEKTGKLSSNKNIDSETEYISVFKSAYEKSIALPKMVELTNFWVEFETLFKSVAEGEEARGCLKDTQNRFLQQIESFYTY